MDYRTRVPAPLNIVIRPAMCVFRGIMCKKKAQPGMQLI